MNYFKRFLAFLCGLGFALNALALRANAEDSLLFRLSVANTDISCKQRKPIEPGKGIIVDRFSLYISHLKFYAQGALIREDAEPLLIQVCDNPQKVTIPVHCDSIAFTLGIDSIIQEQGPIAGNLDPIHGFYWTWQSGYIHLKFEGNLLHDEKFKETNMPFTLHLGGYRGENQCIIARGFSRKSGCNTLRFYLDTLLESEVFLNKPSVMSPGPQARKMAEIIADAINLEP
jgi:hypothetical protein